MLILTRKIDETIYIGKDAEIKVRVLAIQGNNVKLGIDAPIEVPVHRQEIYERIQGEGDKICNQIEEIEMEEKLDIESEEEGETK